MIDVFIQNAAQSLSKRNYNEKTLKYLGLKPVSRAYPYSYGFILNTTSEDGDNRDCFIITKRPLPHESIVRCEPVGLLEQFEDGDVDHNVLAIPAGDSQEIDEEVVNELREFILHVFDHVPGKQISAGRVLDRATALALITACTDPPSTGPD